jgi:hypothetical protein
MLQQLPAQGVSGVRIVDWHARSTAYRGKAVYTEYFVSDIRTFSVFMDPEQGHERRKFRDRARSS